jgi:hypothetical protein
VFRYTLRFFSVVLVVVAAAAFVAGASIWLSEYGDPKDLPSSQWVLFIVQVFTLLAVVIYVWETWQMARATLTAAQASHATLAEMRKARREASDPRPFIYFSVDHSVIDIVIENTGQSTAADVSFTFDPPLQCSRSNEGVRRFFDTSKHLPPGARLQHAFDVWQGYFAANLPLKYSVTLRYQRLDESEYRQETQILDIGSYKDYSQWRRKGLHDAVEELEKIVTKVDQIARGGLSSNRREVAAAELMPTPMTLNESVAVLKGLWNAYQTATKSEVAAPLLHEYLPVMRKAAITALVRLETLRLPEPELRDALQAVFVALHNHNWVVTGDDPQPKLETALAQLAQLGKVSLG